MEFFDKHLILTLVLALLSTTCISASSWERAGCHKVDFFHGQVFTTMFLADISYLRRVGDTNGKILERKDKKMASLIISQTKTFYGIISEDHSDHPNNASCLSSVPVVNFASHTRKIRIPGCVVFDITTNACRGFCQSYSTPSPEWILESNSRQSIWSVGQCCNIMETEDVLVEVMCLGGMKDLVFKSAKTCSCYHCKKE